MKKYITTAAGAAEAMLKIKAYKIIQLDTETRGLHFSLDPVTMVQIGVAKGKQQFLFDVEKIGAVKLGNILRPILESPNHLKIIHNSLFDICMIRANFEIVTAPVFDTALAERVLVCGTKESTALKETLLRRGIAELDKSIVIDFLNVKGFTVEMLNYAAEDVTYLEELMRDQIKSATEEDLKIITLENKVAEVTADMRFRGIKFDSVRWMKIAVENEKKYNQQLKKMPSDVANWGSPTQVKKYFASKGIVIESFSDLDFMGLTEDDPEFKDLLKLRELYQDVKLYGKNWMTVKLNSKAPIQTAPTVINGRVHGNFRQILETGRFSSNQPNLQQIRSGGDHRKCFHPDDGNVFVISDYTGQEIATAAVAAGEYRWIDTIVGGGSIHDLMAAKLFGPNYNNDQRNLTKRINFAILYGSGASTLAKNLLIPVKECQQLIYAWKDAVPNLRNWLANQVRLAESTKESYSLYGRRRSLADVDRVYTIAQNNPIQSTGADMLKVSMVKLYEHFKKVGYGRIALCVHDELILEVPKKHATAVCKITKRLMEEAAEEVLGMKIVETTPYIAERWEKPEKK